MDLIPNRVVPFNYFSIQIAGNYYAAEAIDKGNEITEQILASYESQLKYYLNLDDKYLPSVDEEIQRILYFMREMGMTASKYDQKELSEKITDLFNKYIEIYSS